MKRAGETKEEIRKRHLLCRNRMTEEERIRLSEVIAKHARQILDMVALDERDVKVYGYYPLGSEVSLVSFYGFLLEQKIPLAFPRVGDGSMDFYRVFSLEDFNEGTFHVMEPVPSCRRVEWEHALCLTPGSVFDGRGGRFGYGKGYYDRYFERYPEILRVGIAYGHQMEDRLPAEEWDVPMDYLITEQGMINCGEEL